MGTIHHGIKQEHKNVTLLNTQGNSGCINESINEWMNRIQKSDLLAVSYSNPIYNYAF